MANNFEKILTIEQQIEKLKEKQKRLEGTNAAEHWP